MASTIPIILAMFILNINPNVSCITFKSSEIGFENPNDSPYDSHHKKSTLEAKSPSKPPTTIPHNINTINILKSKENIYEELNWH